LTTDTNSPAAEAKKTWTESLAVYLDRRVVGMLFLGFSAGLPLLLVFGTMSAWLDEEGISKTEIGFFVLVTLPYGFKFLWAPIVDRVRVPFLTHWLGRRRSWMLVAQAGVAAGLVLMGMNGPSEDLLLFAQFALFTSFCSATQDIAIDAYRIERVPTEMQGAMAANYILGYRLGMLIAGGWGALRLADVFDFTTSYVAMAGLMAVGMITALIIAEPERSPLAEAHPLDRPDVRRAYDRMNPMPEFLRLAMAWIYGAALSPLIEFFHRCGFGVAIVVLAFIMVFRLSDLTLGVMAYPFYLDLGFTLTQIADVTKAFGLVALICGAYLGGWMVAAIGVVRTLFAGAALVAGTNLLFAYLATQGPDMTLFYAVIAADNGSAGLATAAFVAFLSGLTNTTFSATQYAVFSSLMLVLGKLIASFSGVVVDQYGFVTFFIYAAALGIPAILLIPVLARWERQGRLAPQQRQEPRDPRADVF